MTGLVLFAFVATHFLNHALGVISLEAMEDGRRWFLGFWRNPLGTVALYGSLVTHAVLGLQALWRRRTLRMPAGEGVQLALGLCVPPLLVYHVTGTRFAHALYGVEDAYGRVVLTLWALAPAVGLRQLVLLTIVWIHGCIGMHAWLRLRSGYPRVAPLCLALAVLLPVLAALGFVTAGRSAAVLARGVAERERLLWSGGPSLTPAARAVLESVPPTAITIYTTALLLVIAGRGIRNVRARRAGVIRVTYPNGRTAEIAPGLTVLEASRVAGIPHASVCGGRGRCSTCRVRVRARTETLPPPAPSELEVLRRVGLPPDVRLACQLRPRGDVAVAPLLPVGVSAADALRSVPEGHEQEVTVLFADLRSFTRIAERRLPYDVVFLLNRYFDAVGGAIERAGGIANQFTGDGVMALFGVSGAPRDGSRAALRAGGDMVAAVAELNRTLGEDLPVPLRIGIGIHTGPAVVGRMGYADGVSLTAVGDTVHVAKRLEELTKQYACQLVISEALAARAGFDATRYPRHELTVRNRTEPLTVRVIEDASSATAGLGPASHSARASVELT
jgi:adenylate cyclase